MAFTVLPFNLLGFRVAGDVSGFTCYTDKFGRKVWYKKAPPDKPPSQRQLDRRRLFKLAVEAWKNLTAEEKQQLEIAASKASLCLTGQNLYTSCSLRAAEGTYRTIERQTHTTLPALAILQ